MFAESLEEFEGFRRFEFCQEVDLKIQMGTSVSLGGSAVLAHQNEEGKEDGLQ